MPTIRIQGMRCQHCVASVTKALEAIDGISDVRVDLEAKEATYSGEADLETVKQAIAAIGFEAEEG